MNLNKFLELSAGKWFAQRTSYQLAQAECQNSKSELSIEILSPEHEQIREICQQFGLAADLTIGGTKLTWDNSVDWGKAKDQGSTVVIYLPEGANTAVGKFWGQRINSSEPLLTGQYLLGQDESLTLIVEDGDFYARERQWFASPNLRLRSSICKYAGSCLTTSFYSEIRKLSTPTQKPANQEATAATGQL